MHASIAMCGSSKGVQDSLRNLFFQNISFMTTVTCQEYSSTILTFVTTTSESPVVVIPCMALYICSRLFLVAFQFAFLRR